MNASSLSEIYEALLRNENQKTLVKTAKAIFAKQVADSVRAGLIVEPSHLDSETGPAELGETRHLFQKTFKTTDVLQSEEVKYPSLAHEYHRHRANLSGRPDSLFRKRSEMVPTLYRTLVAHRNIVAHETDAGTESAILGLCGTIMCVLDLAPAGSGSSSWEKLGEQCVEAILDLAGRVAKQRETDQKEIESVNASPHAAKAKDSGERLGVLTEPPEVRLSEIDAGVRGIAARVEDIDAQLRQVLAQGRRKVVLYEDELGPVLDVDELDHPDETRLDVPKLTVSMARTKLKALRDRIASEHGVEAWENICMMRPIVESALEVARRQGLEGIDHWRRLPEVNSRYERYSDTMERQIEAFGDAMMEVYQQVEKL